jgi:RNA polymerase sigma factor for flagellar operon FliA
MPTNQAFNTSGGTATVEAPVEAPAPSVVPAVPSPPATTSRRAIPEMTADGRPILDVWISYRDERCEETRNVLVEHYLKLVRYTAERLHSRLPSEVDVEDLMSSGLFGLIDAINAFDLERGVKFSTYCTQRIRGAIFDELRAMDWVPRLVRSRTTKMDRARKSLEMTSGRKATEQEVTKHLDVTPDEFEKIRRDSRPVSMVSLNRKWYETDSSRDITEIDVVRDRRQESPVSKLQREDLKYLLTRGLSRAERLIVVLYYYEEMTMKEIGVTLDLSESRVSQMHSSILARLKAQMQHRTKET